MDKTSKTEVKAAPAVVKATRPLKKVNREPEDGSEDHKKDVTEKEQSDKIEMMKGIADRTQRIEEKVDLLISPGCSSNEVAAAFKTGSVQAKAEISWSDHESSSDDEPAKKKAKEDTKNPKEESTSDDSSKESDEKVSGRGIFGRGRGLFVGGRLRGGRCGGLGHCKMYC